MDVGDAGGVLAVYQEGLDTGLASFEVRAPSWEEFDKARLPEHRLVAVEGGVLLGWVAVTPVSSRPVYAGVVEHSVYVAAAARGRGVGLALLRALTESADRAGVWTIQSGVFPENRASLAVHARAGFRVVGRRERIGRHAALPGTPWRDVILIERRSPAVA
jgi:L-amino acid N-acyltransferase YncA